MIATATKKAPRPTKLEYFFSKKVGKAIAIYDMIQDNDKILVGISGGKDSLSLLKTLKYKQKRLPINFDIVACYVDLGLDDERCRVLDDYLKASACDYTIEKSRMWESKKSKNEKMSPALSGNGNAEERKGGVSCFWCAFNRRKRLFQTAERLGCNKVALGHHKDDIAETFLLNLFFHGEISTMLPKQSLFDGRLHIIRPLALCDERYVVSYAKAADFPIFKDKCPNSATSKRVLMKNILRQASKANKDVKTNIFRSMKRIKSDYLIR
ncbi:MAG: tRNA 2-thiocytidine(32) synthetase TtcA [Candidatus Omnitrophica bacterium]|nr:tRNA 2-thiocytidine(32) synthetase TtcA [Candidatus Omnitrophota bacterium]